MFVLCVSLPCVCSKWVHVVEAEPWLGGDVWPVCVMRSYYMSLWSQAIEICTTDRAVRCRFPQWQVKVKWMKMSFSLKGSLVFPVISTYCFNDQMLSLLLLRKSSGQQVCCWLARTTRSKVTHIWVCFTHWCWQRPFRVIWWVAQTTVPKWTFVSLSQLAFFYHSGTIVFMTNH